MGPTGRLRTDPKTRFWSKVEKTGECWEWTAALNNKGYGVIGDGRKLVYAHRLSWEMHTGKKPTADILHSCDNPKCVRPAHLFAGSHAENMFDKQVKGRAAKKLTPELALEIFNAVGEHRDIGRRYGIAHSTVGHIKRGNIWRHVTQA